MREWSEWSEKVKREMGRMCSELDYECVHEQKAVEVDTKSSRLKALRHACIVKRLRYTYIRSRARMYTKAATLYIRS